MSAEIHWDDIELQLRRMPADLQRNAVQSVNRVAERLAHRLAQKTSQKYALTLEQVTQYISVRQASQSAAGDSASVQLQIKAIPAEVFPIRVAMQRFALRQAFGRKTRTYTRALPVVQIKRYRDAGFHRLGKAFPLHQRESGALATGDSVRRRTGSTKEDSRDKLTVMRFYTFPRAFVQDVLLPEAKVFVPQQYNIELRTAYRRQALRYSSSAGGRVVRRELQGNR